METFKETMSVFFSFPPPKRVVGVGWGGGERGVKSSTHAHTHKKRL